MHNAIFLTNYSLLYSPAAALLSRLIIANVTPHHHHPLRCTLYSSRRLVVIDVRWHGSLIHWQMTSISCRLRRRRGTDNLDLSFATTMRSMERGRCSRWRRWRQRWLPTQILWKRLLASRRLLLFGLLLLLLFSRLFTVTLDPGEVNHLIVFGFEV